MSRFRFKLDPLLRARRMAEEAEQRAVAAIERERLGLQQRLRECQARITQRRDGLRAQLSGSLNMLDLRQQAGTTLHALRRAQQVTLELAAVHKRLETARAKLIEASKQRRAIERLRERRFDQWKHAQNKAEIAAMDELAVIAAARKEPDA
jgi:flagellar FliJ protein